MFKPNKLLISLGISLFSFGAFATHATANSAQPGLVEVYQMAAEHDAKLAKAEAEYQADIQIKNQARALLLPTISAKGSVTRHENSISQNSGTDQILSLNLKQPLFNKEAFSRYKQAESQISSAELKFKSAQQDLILRVSQAYFDVLLNQQEVDLALAKEDADKLQFEKAQASFEVGLANRTDVLQAKSSYDLAISTRINAENNLDQSYENLSKLTGQNIYKIKRLLLTTKLDSQALNKQEIEELAQANNLQVLQTQQQEEIAKQEIDAAKAGHWFDVNLTANYSDNRFSSYKNSSRIDNRDTSIGLELSVPLYQGGATSAKVSEARFKHQAAHLGLRDAKEQARIDSRIQAQNLERGISLINALREAVKSSEAFLEAAEEGYKVGLRNMLDVVTARSNLFDAQNNLADALHRQLLTQLQLQATLGNLNLQQLQDIDRLLEN